MLETQRSYVALGDSISIDLYPSLELAEQGRLAPGSRSAPVGAASLLFRNVDDVWPAHAGQDLVSHDPEARFRSLCIDGGTTEDVLRAQLPSLDGRAADLVTLTVGGNDLLEALSAGGSMEDEVSAIIERFDAIVDRLMGPRPRPRVILTTVYDPTDGSGILDGYNDAGPPLPLHHLDRFNDHVRARARGTGALLGDIHRHFLGHGRSAPAPERWYWSPSPIEPSARGASEVRRVWWQALTGAG